MTALIGLAILTFDL